ncbi:MAG: iron-sulfur cluster assembly accessory protein [Bacteroidota bacterium]
MDATTTDATTTEPTISVTDRALDRIRFTAIREGVDLKASFLRIGVMPGGCSGLTYDLGWDTTVDPTDREMEFGGIRVRLDLKSYLYLSGSTLDFTDGLQGKGFHFDNPQASRTCACGESFSL